MSRGYTGRTQSSRLFPIPMRGNEIYPGGGFVVTDGQFPIPMRGNELTQQLYQPVFAACSRSP